MKLTQKLEYLLTNHRRDWLRTRREIEDFESNKQSVFCVCGRLSTGLHERNCRKFNDRVTKETVAKLSHLIKDSHEK